MHHNIQMNPSAKRSFRKNQEKLPKHFVLYKTSESNHFEEFTTSRETTSSCCVKILWRVILVWQHLSPRRHSGFISTWYSLGPLIIHIDMIFIQCNGGQDIVKELHISTIETTAPACTKFSIPREEILYPKMQKTSPTKYTNGLSQNGV